MSMSLLPLQTVKMSPSALPLLLTKTPPKRNTRGRKVTKSDKEGRKQQKLSFIEQDSDVNLQHDKSNLMNRLPTGKSSQNLKHKVSRARDNSKHQSNTSKHSKYGST